MPTVQRATSLRSFGGVALAERFSHKKRAHVVKRDKRLRVAYRRISYAAVDGMFRPLLPSCRFGFSVVKLYPIPHDLWRSETEGDTDAACGGEASRFVAVARTEDWRVRGLQRFWSDRNGTELVFCAVPHRGSSDVQALTIRSEPYWVIARVSVA